MNRLVSWTALLLTAALLAGCASAPRSQAPPQEAASDATTLPSPSQLSPTPDRPLPHAPDPEPGFEQAVQSGTRTTSGQPGPDYWQQEATYDLTARVHPDAKRLEGSGTITYTNNAPDALDRLHLELAQNVHKPGVVRNEGQEITGGVTLDRIALNGTPAERGATNGVGYAVRNTQLVLFPTTPIPSGATVTIDVDWSFSIPQQGAGGRMGYDGDDLLFLAYWYPIVSVYDDVTGWMDAPFRGRAEFYSDFASYDLTIHAPESWVVQATGTLQNPADVLTPEVAQRRQQALRSDTPMRILTPEQTGTVDAPSDTLTWRFSAEQVRDAAFHLSRNGYWEAARTAAGDRDGDGRADSTQIHTFWRESAPKWAEVTQYQQHSITQHARHTGVPYPWPHMTAVEGGGIIGGGMEFPMMTIMGDYNNNSARMLYAVTAHELAHMWMPFIVNTNERRYSWMDEGTTSFNENVARGDYFEQSEAIASDRQDYLEFARTEQEGPMRRWSDFHYTSAAFGVASYRKPATVYVALRGLLGEETFNRAYRTFMTDWAYKHPYPSDFFNTIERVAGRDLDWFWYSWYATTWTLDQAIDEVAVSGPQVSVRVADEGRVPMPVRLTVTLANGDTVSRTMPVDVWLQGRTSATTAVSIPAGSTVRRVEIDAAHVFPDVDRSNNVWTRDS